MEPAPQVEGVPTTQVIESWLLCNFSTMFHNSRRAIVRQQANCWMQLFLRSTFCKFWTQISWVFRLRNLQLSEHSSRSAWSNMSLSVFDILFSIKKLFARSWVNYVQTFVRPNLPLFTLWCVQRHLWPGYFGFKNTFVQFLERSFSFPSRLFLNARRPLVRSLWSGHMHVWFGA